MIIQHSCILWEPHCMFRKTWSTIKCIQTWNL